MIKIQFGMFSSYPQQQQKKLKTNPDDLKQNTTLSKLSLFLPLRKGAKQLRLFSSQSYTFLLNLMTAMPCSMEQQQEARRSALNCMTEETGSPLSHKIQ